MASLTITARRRISNAREPFVEGFDTLLADVVFDYFEEDEQLKQLASASAEANAALGKRDTSDEFDEVSTAIDHGIGRLDWAIEQRARERVAELCEKTVLEGAEWTDFHDEEDVREAMTEARSWLAHNTNAAERAGVDYGDLLPSDAELFEEVAADA